MTAPDLKAAQQLLAAIEALDVARDVLAHDLSHRVTSRALEGADALREEFATAAWQLMSPTGGRHAA